VNKTAFFTDCGSKNRQLFGLMKDYSEVFGLAKKKTQQT